MENITLQSASMTNLGGASAPLNLKTFTPKGVCAKLIRFAVEDNRLLQVSFTGGCDGNLKAISALVKGMELEEVISKLSGITCGNKKTSCSDQLCCALKEFMAQNG